MPNVLRPSLGQRTSRPCLNPSSSGKWLKLLNISCDGLCFKRIPPLRYQAIPSHHHTTRFPRTTDHLFASSENRNIQVTHAININRTWNNKLQVPKWRKRFLEVLVYLGMSLSSCAFGMAAEVTENYNRCILTELNAKTCFMVACWWCQSVQWGLLTQAHVGFSFFFLTGNLASLCMVRSRADQDAYIAIFFFLTNWYK